MVAQTADLSLLAVGSSAEIRRLAGPSTRRDGGMNLAGVHLRDAKSEDYA